MSRLTNFLSIIGYEINICEKADEYWTDYEYLLVTSSDGNTERASDISYLRTMLTAHHSDLVYLYDESTTNFGNAHMSVI